jgi:integrase
MARPPTDPIAFGHLRKQSGWWHFRWTHPDTSKQHSQALRTKDKGAAGQLVIGRKLKDKFVPGLADEIEQNGFLPVEKSIKRENRARTFADFATIYTQHMSDSEEWAQTTSVANELIRSHLSDVFGHRSLGGVSRKDVEEYVARRLGQEKRARSTVNKALAFLKGMYRKAVEWGYVNHSPVAEIQMKAPEENPPDALSEKDLDKLLKAMEGTGLAYDVHLVAADTGMRASELRRLTWADVSFEDRAFIVMGRTKKGESAKNRRFRVIPMTNRVLDHLKGVYQEAQVRWANRRDAPLLESLPVLASRNDPTQPFRDVRRSLEQAADKVGLGHVHLHQLRHSYATHLRNRGVEAMEIKDLGGWQTMKMVERYAHADPEKHRKAVASLGR